MQLGGDTQKRFISGGGHTDGSGEGGRPGGPSSLRPGAEEAARSRGRRSAKEEQALRPPPSPSAVWGSPLPENTARG